MYRILKTCAHTICSHAPRASLPSAVTARTSERKSGASERQVFLDTGNVKTTEQYHKTKHYFHGVNGKPHLPLFAEVLVQKKRESKAKPTSGKIGSTQQACEKSRSYCPQPGSPREDSLPDQTHQVLRVPRASPLGKTEAPMTFVSENNKIFLAPPTQTQPPRHSATPLYPLTLYSRYKGSTCYTVTPGPWTLFIFFFSLGTGICLIFHLY